MGECKELGGPMQILTSRDEALYGELMQTGEMELKLSNLHGGAILDLCFNPRSIRLHLISGADRSELACAGRCIKNNSFADGEHLQVRVSPGMDAVLALLCVLGVVIFGHGDQADSRKSRSEPP